MIGWPVAITLSDSPHTYVLTLDDDGSVVDVAVEQGREQVPFTLPLMRELTARFDRLERHVELGGDLAIGSAFGCQPHDPKLARSKGLDAGAPLAPGAGSGRRELLTRTSKRGRALRALAASLGRPARPDDVLRNGRIPGGEAPAFFEVYKRGRDELLAWLTDAGPELKRRLPKP